MKHLDFTKHRFWLYLSMGLAILILFFSNIIWGSVAIPFRSVVGILLGEPTSHSAWNYIVLYSRFPQAVTALLAGASLSVAGLMLQTFFQNPLADASILGISSGANLAVAILVLSTGGLFSTLSFFSFFNHFALVSAAFVGAIGILLLILYFAHRVRNNVLLLIIGIMLGYVSSSVISFLKFFSTSHKIQSFALWGMGDFSAITLDELPLFVFLTVTGLILSILLIKPLNALLLGERYAQNLGVNIKRVRRSIILCTGLLTAIVTAYCGPVSFIGLAVPHIARLLLGSSNHKHLLPVTILSGSIVALLCNWISSVPGSSGILPLNAITPLVGAPIIIYVIRNRHNIHYFN